MSHAMRLDKLLRDVPCQGDATDLSITGLDLDSRRVGRGEAFVALRGLAHHGIEFAAAAHRRGASVTLAEAPMPSGCEEAGPTLWIDDLGQRLGELAACFHGYPGRALDIVGVTGTNGKTSIVQLLQQAWQLLGGRAASIGTLGAGVDGRLLAGERTTPDAIHVQALLAAFRDAGAQNVAMEVSSHALVQGRVNAVPFKLAVFSNLSRDHLDYHGSMDAYFAAKRRLFDWPTLEAAVCNVDDPHGRQLAAAMPGSLARYSFGLVSTDADVTATALESHADGFSFELATPWGRASVHSRLLGRFNVLNLLAVVACLGACGVAFERIVALLPRLQPVPGRMQRSGGGSQPLVVIDYAHTPDALAEALASLRPHTAGQLICVFGAGGDRDRGKRPAMGRAVERLADRFIITDDNPRSEDGAGIVEEIRAGLTRPDAAHVIRDRRQAIADAIGMAGPDDVVLVAGKGHETTQEDALGKHPFNDLEVAAGVLREAGPC